MQIKITFIEKVARMLSKHLFLRVLMIIRGRLRSCLVGQIWRPADPYQTYVSGAFFRQIRNPAISLLNKSLSKALPFVRFRRPAKPRPVYTSGGCFLTPMPASEIGPTRHYYFSIGKVNTGQRFRSLGDPLPMPGFPMLARNLIASLKNSATSKATLLQGFRG